jgi:serine/threonine protein kinase/WD40 repeat protein
MSDAKSQPEQLGSLMDDFVACYRRGERPSVTEYAERHPELAGEIRELFPSLVLMERAGSDDDGLSSGTVTADGRTLERLGEYRILREIGRGGMGIVYEAEQESLGRHVAIKVLPFQALITPKHMKRFQLEARAAAQLHHSNIVPVFGVGEDQGIPYYAMQYIQGLGLDEVVVELRRLRRKTEVEPVRDDDRPHPRSRGGSVASGLISGQWAATPPEDHVPCSHKPDAQARDDSEKRSFAHRVCVPQAEGNNLGPDPETPIDAPAAGQVSDPDRAPRRSPGKSGTRPAADAEAAGLPERTIAADSNNSGTHAPARLKNDSSGSVVLPGDTEPTSSATSDLHYFRSVARVGVQVADALAYAHGQGVLHRDVKPSNLLLDMKGCVWVTDFGLAKTVPLSPTSTRDVEGNLTHSGDLVGTLRYMAPERFRGWSDTRSDIYSLGLTLYEMLTLRPAFDGNDRARLVHQITQDDPARPRKIDARVPRDLETIVLKAIAKEPPARYESAAEMREDLQRFLDDKPIVARRTSLGERTRMWCRRNPLVAGLVAAVALLLVTLAVGSSVAAFRLREKHEAALESLERVQTAESSERAAHKLATRRLFDAYLAQARAGRSSGRAGRRFESLAAIQKAAELVPILELGEDAVRELRDEAVACLTLTDLRAETLLADDTPAGSASRHVAFDRMVDVVARMDSTGEFIVRRMRGGAGQLRLPGSWNEARHAPLIRLCPNDRFIAACGEAADGSSRIRVWNIATETKGISPISAQEPSDRSEKLDLSPFAPVLDLPSTGWRHAYYVAFSRDSRLVAFPESIAHTLVCETETGKQVARLAIDAATSNSLAFCPRGDHLVANTGPRGSDVVIVHIESGRQERVLPHPGYIEHVAWSRDGRLIAAACADKNVYVWSTQNLDAPLTVCRGHLSQAILVAFNHDSTLLMSGSYDGTTRLWDPRRGEQLVSADHRGLRFSDDNRWIAVNDLAVGYGRCELAAGNECRILSTSPPIDHVVDVAFSPDGRFLAGFSRGNGVDVWNIAGGTTEVARINIGVETRSVEFTPDGKSLIASGRGGVGRLPIDAIVSGDSSAVLASREVIAQAAFPCETALSRDGNRLVASLAGDVINLYDLDSPQTPVRMQSVPSFSWFVAISPNGRWAAASEKRNGDIPVWDAATGERLAHLRTTDEGGALVSFSPDNRWLVVSEFGGFVFYDTGSWSKVRRLSGRGTACFGRIAFAPDMRSFAALGQQSVTLYETATFEDIATLSSSRRELLAPGYPEGAGGLSFSPDGGLLAVGTMQGSVQLWNLRSIRAQLAAMNLDWRLPPLSPAPDRDSNELPPIDGPVADLRAPDPSPAERLQRELELLSEKIAANPNDITALERRAELLYHSDRTADAIAAISPLIELQPGQLNHRVRRASLHLLAKDFKAAIDDYETLLKLDANSALAANNLAWIYVSGPAGVRSPEKALPLALRAIELQPNEPYPLNTVGFAYYRLGQLDRAVEFLTAAERANPEGPTAFDHFMLAMCHQKLGHTTKARERFDQALEWWRRQKNLPAGWPDELRQFCLEAAATLSIGEPRGDPKD